MNLKAKESFDYFHITKDSRPIVKYGSDGKERNYAKFKGRVVLAKNATPQLLLIKAEDSDEGNYCCHVYTTDNHEQTCIKLKILGKPFFRCLPSWLVLFCLFLVFQVNYFASGMHYLSDLHFGLHNIRPRLFKRWIMLSSG